MHMPTQSSSEVIKLKEDVYAIAIPDGNSFVLSKDDDVMITQQLGGMFTVELGNGMLARIDGKDAGVLGKEVPAERHISEESLKNKPCEDLVWIKLSTIYDPEIPVNIVELGLIYSCNVLLLDATEDSSEDKFKVIIEMTLTAPGCGMGEVLKQDVENRLKELPMVNSVHVDLVFDPPWEMSMMSEEARLELGML